MLILENTFVTKTILPWSGNIRGELIRTPKLFFIES
jgi:predicted AAA+ superfamily ATPase